MPLSEHKAKTTLTRKKYLQSVYVVKDLYLERRMDSQNSTTEEH